jgi:hypothetical protein
MIDSSLATFFEEGLGIHIGTRDEHLQPNGARGVAVKVEEDGAHLLVFVPKIAAKRILPDLESNGQVAVVFGRPRDDRSCQVKGIFAGVRLAKRTERRFVIAQREGYLDQLEYIGIPRAPAGGWSVWPAVAIRLRVTALFEQTPGPNAGAPIP